MWCGVRRALLVVVAAAALAQPSAARGQPSIVLVLTDDQRWDTLSVMPTVQRELVRKGVSFTNAFVANPLCCPSRASLLTGRYSHSTGVWSNGGPFGGWPRFIPSEPSTVATWLDGAGYETAFVGKYLNNYGGSYVPPGWDRWVALVPPNAGNYYDYELNVDGALESHGSAPADYSTDVLAAEATSFVRSADGPLFLAFAPFAPHPPATPAWRHADAFAGLEPWRPPSHNELDVSDKPGWVGRLPALTAEDEAAVDTFRSDQLTSLLAVDDAVGSILQALAETGRLENTLIVFTSDNGFSWGEHRWRSKRVAYEESIRVPLVVRYDMLASAPRTVDELVTNIDLAPTFADLAGAPAPDVEGASIAPLLAGADVRWRQDFLVEYLEATRASTVPTYCAVRTSRYTYVQYATGAEELYDLVRDPHQLANRAGVLSLRRTLAGFRSRLLTLCRPPPPRFSPRSPCLLLGGEGADLLEGTPYYDLACGRDGSDRIYGRGRADSLYGGAGNDLVAGQSGADRLVGGLGRDHLYAGPGDDVVKAGDGRADRIACGDGLDSVVADRGDTVGSACESVRHG